MSKKEVKVKNVEESINLRMSQLFTMPFDEEVTTAISDCNKLLSKVPFTSAGGNVFDKAFYENEELYNETVEEFKQAVLDALPEGAAKEMETYGAEHPSDVVELHTSLGTLLFDLYRNGVTVPKAPLAQALLNKKMGEYAEKLNGDEVTIPQDVYDVAEGLLTDEEKWAKVGFTAHVKFGDDRPDHYTPLNNAALMAYGNIMAALLNMFMGNTVEEEQVDKTKVTDIKKKEA